MKILALDCATSTGWAIGEGENLLEFGSQDFSLRRGESRGIQFIRFRAWLERMILEGLGTEANREERAWAAGFFDGEGYIGTSQNHDGCVTIALAVVQAGSPELLERFKKAVGGIGYLRGPIDPPGNRRPRWDYTASSLEDVLKVVRAIWPWLGTVKQEQIRTTLQEKWVGAEKPWPLERVAMIRYEQAHHRGGAATEVCVGMVTIVQELAALYGIEHEAVHTGTWKKNVVGKGNADKEECRAAVIVMWNDDLTRLRRAPQNFDESDALGILAYDGR